MTAKMPDADPHDVFVASWEKVKDRTYPLPDGNLTARRTPDTVEVTDEATFLAWAAEEAPTLLKQTPALVEIKKLARMGARVVTAAGEVVPGVRTKPGTINYGATPAVIGEVPAWIALPDSEEVS